MYLSTIDIVIIISYAFIIFILAQWVSRERHHTKNEKDYFLASKALPWWAVGASLIAANISTEQIVGAAGSAYAIGIAIASYEWMSAITILIVGKYFLPIFLKLGIYSMPQFLEQRYGSSVKNLVAAFWVCAYIFIYLTSILWLGALATTTITGISQVLALILLASFATAYSLYGGLRAVAYTDIIQVVLLITGGLAILYIALNEISNQNGVISGFNIMVTTMPEKFDLILSGDSEFYEYMPGISVLLGGMWIINLVYWGLNQYIIQRALAAKNLQEAQKGMLFAGALKLLIPVIVVFPGIAAAYLIPDLRVANGVSDQAYPEMMKLLPTGFKGLVFAALLAAVVSTIASMMNSIATIFTMDLYRSWRKHQETSSTHLVKVGRIASLVSIVIASCVAKPLLGNFDQAFQYIQDAVTFFSPGIAAIFLLGMFWKHTTESAAFLAMLGSIILSIIITLLWPEFPFMDRALLVFFACIAIALIKSAFAGRTGGTMCIKTSTVSFSTPLSYNIGALGLALVLGTIYWTWW